jgi:hypothetical protein
MIPSSAVKAPAWLLQYVNSIERLLLWLTPGSGRTRALRSMAEVKVAIADRQRFHGALCVLARDLDAFYPPGSILTLARQRVQDLALIIGRYGGP